MRTRVFLPLATLLALPAAAETLYDRDGVQLTASTRLINADAATCRIREDRHTTEQYEKLRHNDGQPMGVWRVELVVANYSGKVLDYLNAHLNVRSEWPPCDHWDGLGNYGKPVVWTGPLMTIQEVGSVQPGEERREVEFVLTFHEQEPAFGRWDIDYTFEAAEATSNDIVYQAPPAAGAWSVLPSSCAARGRDPNTDFFLTVSGPQMKLSINGNAIPGQIPPDWISEGVVHWVGGGTAGIPSWEHDPSTNMFFVFNGFYNWVTNFIAAIRNAGSDGEIRFFETWTSDSPVEFARIPVRGAIEAIDAALAACR